MTNYPSYYYPPQYVQPVYQPQIPLQSQQANPTQKQQMQNTGFILVPTEDDVYRYPVTPGNCVTFKVENEPIVIEKSMSFSQLDNPRYDRYRLVREDFVETPQIIDTVEMSHTPADELKDALESIKEELRDIRKKLDKPANNNNQPKRNEVTKDDAK